MTTLTTNTTSPCDTARDALKKAATDLRQSGANVADADRKLKAKTVDLRQLNIKALADRTAMFDAFYAYAVLGQEIKRLQFEVDSYDTEHERAKCKRNAAGDELDRAARVQGTPYMHSPDELERAAVRFAAAQHVLDLLQSKEASAKRRADAVALRQAESAIEELERLYREKDATQKASRETANHSDSEWNQLRSQWMRAMDAESECQKALRKASQDYAASVILQ